MTTPEIREALEVVRNLLPKYRGGHTVACCTANGGKERVAEISPLNCLCSAPSRAALAFLKKHGGTTR